MLLVWLVSGICLIVARRFNSKGAGRSRGSGLITLMHLIVVALGVFAAIRLPAAGVSWPGVMPVAVLLLVVGLALQWYSVIRSAGSVKLIAVGGLVAMIGLSLSFKNWASFLIMCVPCLAVTLWRIRAAQAYGKP